jgi:hypothetical protein
MDSFAASQGRRAALIIAHPGHELLLHGWLERIRPRVYVLTDGSGRTGRSRLPSTSRVLDTLGVERGSVYGRFADAELYSAILRADGMLFDALVDELVDELRNSSVTLVAGDSREGYNPAHDLCRLMIDSAVSRLRSSGGPVDNYEFDLVNLQPGRSESGGVFALDDEALQRKLASARAYKELSGEVLDALNRWGVDAFRLECLRPARDGAGQPPASVPFYEKYGEQQVASGYYRQVLRYRDHLSPLARWLEKKARRAA